MNEQELLIRLTIEKTTGLSVSSDQAHQFLRYYEILIEKNRVMNLTRIVDFEDVVKKHFADSLAIVRYVSIDKQKKVLDLGTGAGFPGMPLAIMFPDVEMTMADSVGKKVNFVKDTAAELGLSHVNCVHGRAEDLAANRTFREQYDLVVSRAVANLSTLSEYCLPFVNAGGIFAAYKSENSGDEIRRAERAIRLLGGGDTRVERYDLFDMQRTIIIVKKLRTTPTAYPRKAGTPSKRPLK